MTPPMTDRVAAYRTIALGNPDGHLLHIGPGIVLGDCPDTHVWWPMTLLERPGDHDLPVIEVGCDEACALLGDRYMEVVIAGNQMLRDIDALRHDPACEIPEGHVYWQLVAVFDRELNDDRIPIPSEPGGHPTLSVLGSVLSADGAAIGVAEAAAADQSHRPHLHVVVGGVG
jgi:hypothetical protein